MGCWALSTYSTDRRRSWQEFAWGNSRTIFNIEWLYLSNSLLESVQPPGVQTNVSVTALFAKVAGNGVAVAFDYSKEKLVKNQK